jgi:hypothetical protein
MTNSLTIEKRNKEVASKLDSINYIIKSAPTKEKAFERLRDILSSDINLGYGGSHIWCANVKNERLFIITGY